MILSITPFRVYNRYGLGWSGVVWLSVCILSGLGLDGVVRFGYQFELSRRARLEMLGGGRGSCRKY